MPETEHRRRHCRHIGEGLSSASFAQRAAERLGRGMAVLATFFLVVALLDLTVPRLLDLDERDTIDIVGSILLTVFCAALAGGILLCRIGTAQALRLGLVVELVGAAVLAVAIYFEPLSDARDFVGVTGSSLWAVVMPFLVPLATRLRWLVTAIASSLPLVVVAVVDPLLGHGSPDLAIAAQVALPNWMCGALGVAASIQVATWGSALSEARREVERIGSYQLVEKLGEGGMGEVWRAEHRLLARPAAIKFVRRSELLDPVSVARFEREALATARLTSPHTVRVYDVGVDDEGRFFYVMELLDGLDLETYLQEHGAMPAARVVHIGIQICRSLAEAHDHGMIHRDIKPANIYLCRHGGEHDVVKVLDFGLVLRQDRRSREDHARLTDAGFVTGTPGFLAPEAARGREDIDHRVDVYSLGCVLFLLLTGQPVIDERDRTPMEVLMAHVKEPRRRPSELVPDVPPAFETLLLDCLAVEPDQRPPDLRSVARRLAECPTGPWTEDDAALWWREHHPAEPGARSTPTAGTTSS